MEQVANPFKIDQTTYSDTGDLHLIEMILLGNKDALHALIERHQQFIFNIALKMINNVQDAEDVTQEVLIKIVVKLSSFDSTKGRFRTWLYRVTFNHILNIKKQKYEHMVPDFETFFNYIENSPTEDMSVEEEVVMSLYIKEARVTCMNGMLMCLDREQRLIYIMGDVFEIDHQLGGEMFNISASNFRQKLSRARKDLYQWMNNRCGLVNKNNPCRCPKKTKGFIAKGWVNPDNMRWHSDYQHSIAELSESRIEDALDTIDKIYVSLYREHPFKHYDKADELLSTITSHPTLKDIFRLDS